LTYLSLAHCDIGRREEKSVPVFNDENISRLFGAEAAEDEPEDRFRQYFFYNQTYDNLISKLPLRILVGHKGVGKSALLKRARLNDVDSNALGIWLTPGDVAAVSVRQTVDDFTSFVEYWKQGILAIIAKHILGDAADELLNKETMGRIASRISSFIPTLMSKLSENAGGPAPFPQPVLDNFTKTGVINIYVDDIDRGWSASRADIRNISAVLNAMRDISGGDQRIRFRIGLRSDVYFLVRTSDESTDKIESNVIWLSWSNHEILCVMAKRIETFFGFNREQAAILKLNQTDITKNILSKVIEPVYAGVGHWSSRPIHNVLLSLTRQRPRDLVKLMHGAARKAAAARNEIISSTNLERSFEEYSNERLQDIINEFRSELPGIERLLLEMKPSKKERTAAESYLFSNDKMSAKLREVMQHVNLAFTNGRPVTGKALTQFLYKIDFITARKNLPGGSIERRYFDRSRFLASEFADFGFDWEIHPAYRWALQPQDIQAVIQSLGR
jgi:hypothetical protein